MMHLLVVCVLAAAGAKSGSGPKGAIAIKSITAGARVFVDGEPAGATPTIVKQLAVGEHTVKVVRLGYLSFEESVSVMAGRTAEVQADLLPISGVLKVTVSGKVAQAQVFVDGKLVGTAPYEGEAAVGKRTVEVRKEGYASFKQLLSVGAGNDYSVVATLQKQKAAASEDDLPLVAIAPKKKADDSDDIPLAMPVSKTAAAKGTGKPISPVTPLPAEDVPGVQANAGSDPSEATPVYEKWWFWTATGAAVAAAIIIPVAIASGSSGEPRQFLPGLSQPWVLNPAR